MGSASAVLTIADESLALIARAADGDVRRALTLLEIAADVANDGVIDDTTLAQVLADRTRRFDKGGEQFYDQISALHKSVRSSDADAALYWCTRMLDGGVDPAYLARRLTRMAIEDVGLADPRALTLALEAWETFDRLGSPEGELALAEAAIYLAIAAKSNAAYTRVRRGARTDRADRHAGRAAAPAQRADETHEGSRLRQGLSVRSRQSKAASPTSSNACRMRCAGASSIKPTDRGLEGKIGEKLEAVRTARARAAKGKGDA